MIEEAQYNIVKYVIMALILAGAFTIPLIIKVRGDTFAGRFVVALYTLVVVALASWVATKGLRWGWGEYWRRRAQRGDGNKG